MYPPSGSGCYRDKSDLPVLGDRLAAGDSDEDGLPVLADRKRIRVPADGVIVVEGAVSVCPERVVARTRNVKGNIR